MTKDEIEDAIIDILIEDGSDRHSDGSDVITSFIQSLLGSTGKDWIKTYRITKGITYFHVEKD
jgi:hypothetical protein